MTALYRLIVSWLVWLSAEPRAVDIERPRAAAAVHAAMASLTKESPRPTPPGPVPKPAGCCEDCGDTGHLVMPDGHRVPCPCPPTCRCKSKSAALPTAGSPAVP